MASEIDPSSAPSASQPKPGALSEARTTAQAGPTLPFRFITLLFIGSGFTGLVDQIAFSKYLTYVVGSTAYAVSAVLAAFMTGLALGAFLGGKLSHRIQRPLLAYGILEIVVTLAVALAPWAFQALTPLYVALASGAEDSLLWASGVRWLLAVLFVVVPTTAMGATLPFLSRIVGADLSDDSAGNQLKERRLGRLYAANTLGGALGALSAAYVILPAAGLRGTLWLSAAGSLVIGLLSVQRGLELRSSAGEEDTASSPQQHSMGKLLPTLAFASGCLVFACEVIFTHLLALIIGNSAYAFGLILAVFLLCLFAGASLAPKLNERLGSLALPLGLSAAALGLALTLPLWDRLPLLFSGLGAHVTSFAGREAVRASAAFIILLVPTTLLGLTFPLLLLRIAADRDVGAKVGRLTAINTVGAVCGALLTGYLVLPQLGSEGSLKAVACAVALLGLLTLPRLQLKTRRAAQVGLALGLVALLSPLALPKWNLARLTSGVNVYFEGYVEPERIPFIREDVHGGVTTVTQTGPLITLYTNGKFQGNNGHELQAQYSFAHYPSLFVKQWDRALIIGLGTGTTLGTFNAYPWKQVDVVEISPSIVEAARKYFHDINNDALSDPRVRLHLDDGRNHLLMHPEKYDLIGMELSSVWFAGASSLYSKEFYELTKSRLLPHGIFQQWVQLHHIDGHTFARILGSLRQVFPHVLLFYSGGQGILIASEQPLSTSAAKLSELSARPGIRERLLQGTELADLLQFLLIGEGDLDRYLQAEAEQAGLPIEALISTDNNLYLEYATPKGNVLPWEYRDVLLKQIRSFAQESTGQKLLVP